MNFIKGVKMEHKKTFGFSGFALLTIAIVSLIGVGFAVAYTGSAVNKDNEMSGEVITVELLKGDDGFYSNFLAGKYSVNTLNNGTGSITLSGLAKDGNTLSDGSVYFKYEDVDDGKFSVADEDSGYGAVEAATITVKLTQTGDAKATDVNLAIIGAQASVVNQYGISFVYVCDGKVFNPANGIQNITLNNGSASLDLKAYVIYSKSVPTTSIGDIKGFALENENITFTANASTPAVTPDP